MSTATLVTHRPLSDQAQQVWDFMIRNGSIDKADAMKLDPPVWNLPGRIFDIREAFGHASVETVDVPNKNGGTRARYEVRGFGEAQTSLFLETDVASTRRAPHGGCADMDLAELKDVGGLGAVPVGNMGTYVRGAQGMAQGAVVMCSATESYMGSRSLGNTSSTTFATTAEDDDAA